MNLSEIILCGLLLVSAIPTAYFGLALLIGTTETKVTGEKVLYENNLGITLSKVRYGDWMIVSDIHTEYEHEYLNAEYGIDYVMAWDLYLIEPENQN